LSVYSEVEDERRTGYAHGNHMPLHFVVWRGSSWSDVAGYDRGPPQRRDRAVHRRGWHLPQRRRHRPPGRRPAAGAKTTTGRPARPLHDAGKRRSAERCSPDQPVSCGALVSVAMPESAATNAASHSTRRTPSSEIVCRPPTSLRASIPRQRVRSPTPQLPHTTLTPVCNLSLSDIHAVTQ
jgi:hypothetical protein